MLHDYHLYTAPEAIRAAHPDAFLHHFVHIPWSQPDYWRILPPHIREGILRGLLANDIVAFHTRSYARNFLLCCEDLLDLRVDYDRRLVRWEGRDVWVRSYPISVNAPMFEELAALARGGRGGGPDPAPPAPAPGGARRPHGPLEEHAARVQGLRRLPGPAPRVPRGHHVLRPAPADAPGRGRVRRVPGEDPRRGEPHQPQARHHRTGCRSTCASRATSTARWRPTSTTTC